ncbi:putative bifunctional diguanylate cyclase/phosphodiesterase [Saccharospirillum mangrovi]|uniref:putative bifunctional diguanylate cyclase/phosphodiesterase n=1 Tax=Saccharospirillum mangrovi TaxID=2161747 RepID=UPI0013B3A6CD|nr:bifunctional diguanylate cyclase/phosphodiesterase [Saccharospirillum mangrovi]
MDGQTLWALGLAGPVALAVLVYWGWRRQRRRIARLRATLASSPDFVFELDGDGRFCDVHSPVPEVLYRPRAAYLGATPETVLPEDAALVVRRLLESEPGWESQRSDQLSLPVDGHWRWFEVTASFSAHPRPGRWLLWMHDITDQKEALADHQISALALQTQDAVLITDRDQRILRVNAAFTDITGYREDEVIGRKPSLLSSGIHDADFYRQLWQTIERDGYWSGEICNRRKNGELFTERTVIKAVRDGNRRVTHYIASFSDITERKAVEARMQKLAYQDPLTLLANRRLLIERLDGVRAQSRRTGQFAALLFVDLDHFKQLNDAFGHALGDELLIQVARRMKACSRTSDSLARTGGDEFVVLVGGLSSDQATAERAVQAYGDKLLAALRRPYNLQGQAYLLSASIGATLFRGDERSVDTLLVSADLAMYASKQSGRDQLCFFEPDMQARLQRRNQLELDLREALENDQFELHYQPRTNLHGRILGYEALLRWRHPRLGVLQPEHFLGMAEANGLIIDIGRWALRQVCEQSQRLAGETALPISLNISTRQWLTADFVAQVDAILALTGADPALLEFEVTEALISRDLDRSRERMAQLSEMGVRFVLDDFGTGCLSLPLLHALPLDRLKIDASLIEGLTARSSAYTLVKSIIAMARPLGLQVLAEGVESPEQVQILSALGCDQCQGYCFGPPRLLSQN